MDVNFEFLVIFRSWRGLKCTNRRFRKYLEFKKAQNPVKKNLIISFILIHFLYSLAPKCPALIRRINYQNRSLFLKNSCRPGHFDDLLVLFISCSLSKTYYTLLRINSSCNILILDPGILKPIFAIAVMCLSIEGS